MKKLLALALLWATPVAAQPPTLFSTTDYYTAQQIASNLSASPGAIQYTVVQSCIPNPAVGQYEWQLFSVIFFEDQINAVQFLSSTGLQPLNYSSVSFMGPNKSLLNVPCTNTTTGVGYGLVITVSGTSITINTQQDYPAFKYLAQTLEGQVYSTTACGVPMNLYTIIQIGHPLIIEAAPNFLPSSVTADFPGVVQLNGCVTVQ